jgi:hypothetical protein
VVAESWWFGSSFVPHGGIFEKPEILPQTRMPYPDFSLRGKSEQSHESTAINFALGLSDRHSKSFKIFGRVCLNLLPIYNITFGFEGNAKVK